MRWLLSLACLLMPALVVAQPCTHYADTNGTGSVCSQAQPCKPQSLWGVVGPGDTACLNDGVYQGADEMLAPTVNGTSGNYLTMRCLNPGACRLDGQAARIPVDFTDRSWVRVVGVNAHNSNGAVINLNRTDQFEVIEVVAWDGNPNIINGNGIYYPNASNGLIARSAAFGSGRNGIAGIDATNITVRRNVAIHEGINLDNDSLAIQTCRSGDNNNLYENNISTAWQDPALGVGSTNNLQGLFNAQCGDVTTGPHPDGNHRIYGNVSYILNGRMQRGISHGIRQLLTDFVEWKEHAVHIASGYSGTQTIFARDETLPVQGVSFTDMILQGDTPASIGSQYTTTNVQSCGSDGVGCPSIYTLPGLCQQYVDGVLTSNPLWPWPMNQRLIDAMTLNNSARVIDINAEVQSVFGAFPAGCTTSSTAVSIYRNGILRNGTYR